MGAVRLVLLLALTAIPSTAVRDGGNSESKRETEGGSMMRNASGPDSKREMQRPHGANRSNVAWNASDAEAIRKREMERSAWNASDAEAIWNASDANSKREQPSLRGSGAGSGAVSVRHGTPAPRSAKKGKRSMQVKASMRMTIKNVNFTKLTKQTKERLSKAVRSRVAHAADVPELAVSVTLSAGSVKIDARIAYEKEMLEEAATMREQMKATLAAEADGVRQEVLQHSLNDEGIQMAKTGDLEVTRPEAETNVTIGELQAQQLALAKDGWGTYEPLPGNGTISGARGLAVGGWLMVWMILSSAA